MSLKFYQKKIEQELRLAIERMGEKSALRDACEYAVMNGGKRLRPMIVLMVAEALGRSFDVMPAALSVEFFHTASLIADDLPSMDDDDVRRGKPSLHKAFPENLALLASYTLIAAGYGGIHENGKRMRENGAAVALQCLEVATRTAGLQGATQGQFLDLYPPDEGIGTFKRIVEMKTSSLFEVSFLFGWLFGGGSWDRVDEVRKCAFHLGLAFQVADDIDDADQVGGTNFVSLCGKEKAISLFEEEIASFRESLEGLGLWTSAFQKLFRALDAKGRLPSRFFSGV